MLAFACRGCGSVFPADAPPPARCPNAGRDGADHVVSRALVPPLAPFRWGASAGDVSPFIRYRALTAAHALAASHGMSDGEFVGIVRQLDDTVARVGGVGFVTTPFGRDARLSGALGLESPGGVWVKDETRNVSGSHKGRHLMGLAVLGAVTERLGLGAHAGAPPARLAIASCGNAALAAAVVARAWGRPLDVYIPSDASPSVVRQLEAHGAAVRVCPRAPGVVGDPCYLAFRAAVEAGAVPFCCQGSDNGMTIEGGETLGWEVVEALLAGSAVAPEPARGLDRVFVQVGGGALASAFIAAFDDARACGAPVARPRIHAVQTRGASPLRRAWERVAVRAGRALGLGPDLPDAERAEALKTEARGAGVRGALEHARAHRAEYMWPWETPPVSVAHGILDDETYDWHAIVTGMIESGGFPVVVSEERLLEASGLAHTTTGVDVDETGAAGLAGLIELRGSVGATERVGILFSGVRR